MMYSKTISFRWADIDPNFHVRHSVYYDLAAQHRIELLAAAGLTVQFMQQHQFGPVLFREECVFLREMKLTDTITIAASLQKAKPDASRWTIQHQFTNQDGVKCAVLTVDGAWIDTAKRKLANPIPQLVVEVMNSFPKGEEFEES
ncbi:MAG: thioesterase [Hymenobacter sp.]|nr:MAG: thioesterase [Hymenobacter sp.]